NYDRAFLDNKAALRSVLLTSGLAQTETVAMLWRGRAVVHPFSQDGQPVFIEELERWLIADGGPFVIKPENGGRGEGVYVLEVEGQALTCRRGTTRRAFRRFNRRPALIERRIAQAEFWHTLYPETLNTIRVLTLWADGADRPFLARAVQRIGVAATVPADNFTAGGIVAPIDLASGRLHAGFRRSGGAERLTHHPESGAQIEGRTLPGWSAIQDTVLRAASSLPVFTYVGWDVFVDSSGKVIVGEGNGRMPVDMLQPQSGLLSDPAIRAFYRGCGAV
ncbi:MAG TPA: sugar-transfer associated ATP-grasp domain-containing protein, partial [Gemmatimonadales bacterium]|nr:sugar-transfer associated ATP-grasp domain-containing protein [Gemmatimonadales bacterium]